jgi:hypothetical protein
MTDLRRDSHFMTDLGQDSSSPPGLAVSLAAALASPTPRWNPASRSRAAAADRFGKTVSVLGMPPGTRLAFGSRFGSPAGVAPLEDGESTVFAAFQPSSAGDDQPLPAAAVIPEELPDASRRPPNQFDSIESKIGSLRVSEGPSTGGMITPPWAEFFS